MLFLSNIIYFNKIYTIIVDSERNTPLILYDVDVQPILLKLISTYLHERKRPKYNEEEKRTFKKYMTFLMVI